MSDSIVIRRAIEGDAAAMAAYVDALVAENLDTIALRKSFSVEEELEIIRKAWAHGRAFFLLAFDGPQAVGQLDLWAGGRPTDEHAGRLGMSVARSWRGRGLGARLLDAAINETKAWPGFCRIELEVAPWNVRAIALYERFGFEHEGRKRKAFAMRSAPEDSLLMARVW
jgi:RimJ/RimL family protein N-acetyltransferase